ncbi:hypothetical protein BVG81_008765, partial [Haliangium sp. UPWRP_2]
MKPPHPPLQPASLLLSSMFPRGDAGQPGPASENGPLPNVPPLYQSVGYELTDLAALQLAVDGGRHLYVRHGAPNEE